MLPYNKKYPCNRFQESNFEIPEHFQHIKDQFSYFYDIIILNDDEYFLPTFFERT